jgi:asparagine synthase (glutamine-hydrolysing)
MCGIAGFLSAGGFSSPDAEPIIEAQTRALSHRGPDDAGSWLDAEAGVALGHRRLSILDLSPAGHQPMVSASGRFVITLNGEIYNHLQLREQLQSIGSAPGWRGHSDTETLLAGFDQWGVEPTLLRSIGMFAFAAWDRRERSLILARDRMGEKPLYYSRQGQLLIFGSELKALRSHPGFRAEIDRGVLGDYLRRGYVSAPQCIYRHTFKLPAGTTLRISPEHAADTLPSPTAYWSLRDVLERGRRDPFRGGDDEAARLLEEIVGQAAARQSVADVPLGAFLSGGIDSSLVVALMQSRASKPVKTFTIGFKEPRFNEAVHARAVAEHLGTDHTELYVDSDDAMRVIPKLPRIFDEPFGDSSAIPTYLVAQLARSQVTVSLSGDGGDELFGGYARYLRTGDLWSRVQRIPAPLRTSMACGARVVEPFIRSTSFEPALRRFGQYLSARSAPECYELQTTYYPGSPDAVLDGGRAPSVLAGAHRDVPGIDSIFDYMMYEDARTYLPDDILAKVDRASMAVGLESRVPLLDHQVVDFAWRLPLRMKMRDGRGKWLLKRVLRRHLPDRLVDRKKMGFGVPVGDWIRGPLREWAEDLLSAQRLRRQDLLDERIVRARWAQHLRGGRVSSDAIWPLLMFQAWLDA